MKLKLNKFKRIDVLYKSMQVIVIKEFFNNNITYL